MKDIPELPSCGHVGADFLRIYTSHGRSMKTRNCQLCHFEFIDQCSTIERVPHKYASYAHAVAGACQLIQLGAKTTLRVLGALADICNSGDFESGWAVWCERNFPEIYVAAALTLPMDEALVKLAKEAHRPTIRLAAAPGMSSSVKEVIEGALDDARWTITQGKKWAPLVKFIHSAGIQSVRIRGLNGADGERMQVAQRIESDRKKLNASLVIMVTDTWVAKHGEAMRPSMSPTKQEALFVAVWGADRISTMGMSKYTRGLDGSVVFNEFKWYEPGSGINRFAYEAENQEEADRTEADMTEEVTNA